MLKKEKYIDTPKDLHLKNKPPYFIGLILRGPNTFQIEN